MCVLCTYLETENNFKGSMLFLVSIVGLGRAVGSITWISGTRIHPVRVYLRRTESRFLEFLNLDSFVLQILFYQHSSCPIFCLSLSLSLFHTVFYLVHSVCFIFLPFTVIKKRLRTTDVQIARLVIDQLRNILHCL